MDCLCDRAPVPHQDAGGCLFPVLMTGGMVAFMTTANGLRNTGLEFLEQSLWLYPLVFCLSLLLRIEFSGKVVGYLRERFVDSRLKGARHAIAMTVLNTAVTSPIMCGILTLLLVGPENFWANYFATLPITAPTSIVVSYFIVGPAVKMFFNNRISPAKGANLLEKFEEASDPLTRICGLS